MTCTQPELKPGSARLISLKRVVAVLLLPQVAAERVERHAEAVADAVGVDLLQRRAVAAAALGAEPVERVVLGRGAVGVQAQDHAGQVLGVGVRAAELVVADRALVRRPFHCG